MPVKENVMKAKDLMVPLSDYLTPEISLKEAAKRMKAVRRGGTPIPGVKGMPVLDPAGNLVGMVSIDDVLRAVLPFYMSLASVGDLTWEGMMESVARKLKGKTVGDVMAREVITVTEDAPLMECLDHMVNNKVRRLPVVDGAGHVLGMIYERDLFFAIVDAWEKNGGEGD